MRNQFRIFCVLRDLCGKVRSVNEKQTAGPYEEPGRYELSRPSL